MPEKAAMDQIYEFPDDVEETFNRVLYKEYALIRKEINTYNEYYTNAIFSDNTNVIYIVDELADINLGDQISKDTPLGFYLDAEVLSTINGIVLYIDQNDEIYTITCFDIESYYIEAYIPEEDYYKYQMNYSSKFEYILNDDLVMPLKIDRIEYKIVNNLVKFRFLPTSLDYSIMPGANVTVRYKTGIDDCKVFVNSRAFENNYRTPYNGENSYFDCLVETDTGYVELQVRFGRQIGFLTGIYLEDLSIEKILVRQR
jgi:hypothetical protein